MHWINHLGDLPAAQSILVSRVEPLAAQHLVLSPVVTVHLPLGVQPQHKQRHRQHCSWVHPQPLPLGWHLILLLAFQPSICTAVVLQCLHTQHPNSHVTRQLLLRAMVQSPRSPPSPTPLRTCLQHLLPLRVGLLAPLAALAHITLLSLALLILSMTIALMVATATRAGAQSHLQRVTHDPPTTA